LICTYEDCVGTVVTCTEKSASIPVMPPLSLISDLETSHTSPSLLALVPISFSTSPIVVQLRVVKFIRIAPSSLALSLVSQSRRPSKLTANFTCVVPISTSSFYSIEANSALRADRRPNVGGACRHGKVPRSHRRPRHRQWCCHHIAWELVFERRRLYPTTPRTLDTRCPERE
jgi:hypothetical protein